MMSDSPINNRVILVILIATISSIGGFYTAKKKYEPDYEHRSWLAIYESLDRRPRNGYEWEGIVFPNNEGSVTIYGYGFNSKSPPFGDTSNEYCDEIKRRMIRKFP